MRPAAAQAEVLLAPQVIACGHWQQSGLLYVLHPKWSYRLNADFEDHAEREYMLFVGEHPEWETEQFGSDIAIPRDVDGPPEPEPSQILRESWSR